MNEVVCFAVVEINNLVFSVGVEKILLVCIAFVDIIVLVCFGDIEINVVVCIAGEVMIVLVFIAVGAIKDEDNKTFVILTGISDIISFNVVKTSAIVLVDINDCIFVVKMNIVV